MLHVHVEPTNKSVEWKKKRHHRDYQHPEVEDETGSETVSESDLYEDDYHTFAKNVESEEDLSDNGDETSSSEANTATARSEHQTPTQNERNSGEARSQQVLENSANHAKEYNQDLKEIAVQVRSITYRAENIM